MTKLEQPSRTVAGQWSNHEIKAPRSHRHRGADTEGCSQLQAVSTQRQARSIRGIDHERVANQEYPEVVLRHVGEEM